MTDEISRIIVITVRAVDNIRKLIFSDVRHYLFARNTKQRSDVTIPFVRNSADTGR